MQNVSVFWNPKDPWVLPTDALWWEEMGCALC